MLKKLIFAAALGATAALGVSTSASAFPATAQPGETVGYARGFPLPEGVYFANTLSWGVRPQPGPGNAKALVDIPLILWATPWRVLGAQVQVWGALPNAHLDNPGGANDHYGLYNPFAAATLAWDLGGGFGVSYSSGVYFNAGDKDIRVHATTWRQDFAASYTANGWNLTANLLWGITFDTSDKFGGKTANGFNLDLTATKTFGKWELGLAAFGSRTYDEPNGFARQKQFALGPLVGYNFGPLILQSYLTRDVYQRSLGGHETRLWTRVIIPLWTPAAPSPLVAKY